MQDQRDGTSPTTALTASPQIVGLWLTDCPGRYRARLKSRAIGSGGCRLPGVTAPDIDDGAGPFRVGNGLPQGGGDLGLEQLQAAGELSLNRRVCRRRS